MTREEAIMWLDSMNIKEFGWDEYAMQESQKEIRERCEQCAKDAIAMAIDALKELSSTNTVQGKWIRKVNVQANHLGNDKEYDDCSIYWYECDQCGARPPKDQFGYEWHSNYCPYCGAEMRSDE